MPESTDSFPWDDLTSLVIYAGRSVSDEPTGDLPHLVLHEYDADKNFLMVDGTPHLTVVSFEDLAQELKQVKTLIVGALEEVIISKLEGWVSERSSEGFKFFLYELEPPFLAGRAYPVALKAEGE